LFAEKSGTVSRVDTPIYEVPKLIRAQDNTSFVLPENRNELLQTLLSKLDTSNTVTQMYPTVSEGENAQKPAPAEAIVAVFAPRAPGSFTRSIKEITFGSSQNAEPFIIMKATSFDVAFAGMLTWEIMMSADLAPLFGPTVLETFDPQARTASGARDAFFKDVIASNKSARVLLDENGDDRIVYTFTDQNTILITTNRETLAELIGLVN
jgi:type II secretory pathway component GspD/PulD (secretin)